MTRRRAVARLAVLGTFLATLLAPPSSGQSRLSDVEVLVECDWPEVVDRGYVPARVELSNRSGEARRVEFSSSGGTWNLNLEARCTVQVPAGERMRFEVLLPTLVGSQSPGSGGSSGLYVTVAGDGEFFDLGTGTSGWSPGNRAVMVFGEEAPGRVAVAQLETDLQDPDLVDPGASRRTIDRTGEFSLSLGAAAFDAMPLGPAGFSSLDAVVLDLGDGLPTPEKLEALAAWVRTGGTLVVFGDASARERLGATDAFQAAFEERFEVAPGAGVWRFGLGRLAVQAGGSYGDARGAAFLKDALFETQEPDGPGAPWMPASNGPWRAAGETLEAPDFGRLPVRAFLLLLLGFAVLIGPVNLFAIRRLARPGLLLITIPALSLLASAGVLAYGVLHQGLGTKAVASTLSVLDQRVARVATVEHRYLFVGMSPGRGLLPAAGTTVFPRRVENEELTFEVRQGAGVELAGDFLPVRTPVEQVLTSARSARLGLAFEKAEDGGWTVTNRLETGVIQVLLVDLAGDVHVGGPVGAGRSVPLARLSPAKDQEAVTTARLDLVRRTLLRDPQLVPGSYLARLQENPFRDACMLDLEDQGSIHVLEGILSLDEQEWSR